MNPPTEVEIEQRLKQLDEIRQFSREKWQWVASMYGQIGGKPKQANQSTAESAVAPITVAQQQPQPSQSQPQHKAKSPPGDSFLSADLIKAYHKLADKQIAAMEASQPPQLKRLKCRKKSKQKLNVYSSKRLSYTEVVRKVIEHQNEVLQTVAEGREQRQRKEQNQQEQRRGDD